MQPRHVGHSLPVVIGGDEDRVQARVLARPCRAPVTSPRMCRLRRRRRGPTWRILRHSGSGSSTKASAARSYRAAIGCVHSLLRVAALETRAARQRGGKRETILTSQRARLKNRVVGEPHRAESRERGDNARRTPGRRSTAGFFRRREGAPCYGAGLSTAGLDECPESPRAATCTARGQRRARGGHSSRRGRQPGPSDQPTRNSTSPRSSPLRELRLSTQVEPQLGRRASQHELISVTPDAVAKFLGRSAAETQTPSRDPGGASSPSRPCRRARSVPRWSSPNPRSHCRPLCR